MNDKVALQFKPENYTVNSNHKLEKDITIDKSGVVKGSKSYYNCPSKFGKHKFILDINNYGMLVTFNPQKYVEHNFITDGFLTYKKFNDVTSAIEQKINDEVGVNVSFKKGVISRYDNSFDIIATATYQTCKNVLNQLVGGKTKAFRNANELLIKDSLYLGNKTEQIVVYNKSKEIQDNLQHYSYLTELPENLIRIEHRHLKSKRLNLSFSELNEDKYNQIRMNSKEKVNQALFNKSITYKTVENLIIELLHSNLQRNELNIALANFLLYDKNINLNKIKVSKKNPNYRIWYDFKRQHSTKVNIVNKFVVDVYNDLKSKFNQS